MGKVIKILFMNLSDLEYKILYLIDFIILVNHMKVFTTVLRFQSLVLLICLIKVKFVCIFSHYNKCNYYKSEAE